MYTFSIKRSITPFRWESGFVDIIKDEVTAVLQSDFLKHLKSYVQNLKPGMEW